MHSIDRKPSKRVLIAKVGLDGHEASAKMISLILRDAGYEVMYLGPRQTPLGVVQVAEQEDVALIGISLLSGSHRYVSREILRLLGERHLAIPLVMGGIIPPRDQDELRAMGVAAVFGPGSKTADILRTIGALVAAPRRGPDLVI
jgi:methylmalonyl-CoA mutase C-terminal domain/subunit